jgi:alkylhydroperoxidase family enzyme
MARISLATAEDLPEGDEDLLKSLSPKEGLPDEYHHLIEDPVRNIYRTVGQAPPVLEAFRDFGRVLWEECGVSSRRRELAILSTARAHDAAYEWHQHVRVGLKEGLTPTEIRAIGASDWAQFDADDRAIIEFATAFATQTLSLPVFSAFTERFSERGAVGLGTLVGLYTVIALLEDGFDIETKEPFVGWDLAGL